MNNLEVLRSRLCAPKGGPSMVSDGKLGVKRGTLGSWVSAILLTLTEAFSQVTFNYIVYLPKRNSKGTF